MPHGQSVYVYGIQLFLYLFDFLGVGRALKITEHDICFRPRSHLRQIHRELRVPDPAAYERGVEYQRLDKAVVRAPEHLVILRLVHAPCGICPNVYYHGLAEALDYHAQSAREYKGLEPVEVVYDLRLDIGHERVRKFARRVYILELFLVRVHHEAHYLLHEPVLYEAVDEPQHGAAAAYHYLTAHKVEALAHAQAQIERRYVRLIVSRKSLLFHMNIPPKKMIYGNCFPPYIISVFCEIIRYNNSIPLSRTRAAGRQHRSELIRSAAEPP